MMLFTELRKCTRVLLRIFLLTAIQDCNAVIHKKKRFLTSFTEGPDPDGHFDFVCNHDGCWLGYYTFKEGVKCAKRDKN